jgi:hypothetical protein
MRRVPAPIPLEADSEGEKVEEDGEPEQSICAGDISGIGSIVSRISFNDGIPHVGGHYELPPARKDG